MIEYFIYEGFGFHIPVEVIFDDSCRSFKIMKQILVILN